MSESHVLLTKKQIVFLSGNFCPPFIIEISFTERPVKSIGHLDKGSKDNIYIFHIIFTTQYKKSLFVIYVRGRPDGSLVQLAECSHGKREALGSFESRSGHDFSSPVTFGGSMWVRG